MGVSEKQTVSISNISKSEASDWILSFKPSLAVGILLQGDRWHCVTDFLATKINHNKIVAIVTIARNGEMGEGFPTFVALYVLPEMRRQGIGKQLFMSTIDYMIENKMTPIHIDILNSTIKKFLAEVDKEKFVNILYIDHSKTIGKALDSRMKNGK